MNFFGKKKETINNSKAHNIIAENLLKIGRSNINNPEQLAKIKDAVFLLKEVAEWEKARLY